MEKMEQIKKLEQELKEWQSQEVRERFEQVGSKLYLIKINALKFQINRLKKN